MRARVPHMFFTNIQGRATPGLNTHTCLAQIRGALQQQRLLCKPITCSILLAQEKTKDGMAGQQKQIFAHSSNKLHQGLLVGLGRTLQKRYYQLRVALKYRGATLWRIKGKLLN